MFRVEKADPNQAPEKKRARAGSIKTDRFSGWIEEVTGQAPSRNRLLGSNTRGGDYQKKAIQQNRLTAGLSLIGPKDFDDIPEANRIPAMLRLLASNPHTGQSNGLFIVEGGNWVPGIYKFEKGVYIKDAKIQDARAGIQPVPSPG
jgi:hypothetical protein